MFHQEGKGLGCVVLGESLGVYLGFSRGEQRKDNMRPTNAIPRLELDFDDNVEERDYV